MEKVFVFVRRPAEESPAEFRSRYLGEHAASLVQQEPIVRYAANLVEDVPAEMIQAGWYGSVPGVDAIDEVWVRSPQSLLGLYRDNPAVVGAYRVTETLVRAFPPTWPLGQRSPLVKRISLLQRAAGMSHQEFIDYWKHRHAPLALYHHAGAVHYVQNPVINALTPESPECDGIVQLHYWGVNGFVTGHFSRPDSKEVILADVPRFIAPGARSFFASEYILKA